LRFVVGGGKRTGPSSSKSICPPRKKEFRENPHGEGWKNGSCGKFPSLGVGKGNWGKRKKKGRCPEGRSQTLTRKRETPECTWTAGAGVRNESEEREGKDLQGPRSPPEKLNLRHHAPNDCEPISENWGKRKVQT